VKSRGEVDGLQGGLEIVPRHKRSIAQDNAEAVGSAVALHVQNGISAGGLNARQHVL
jgi:hypothetical protein